MLIFHRPEIQNKSRNMPQLGATGLTSHEPCRSNVNRTRSSCIPKVGKGRGPESLHCPASLPLSPQTTESHHPCEAAVKEDASPAVPAKRTPPGGLVQMAQNPNATFCMRKWYKNMAGRETAGCDQRSPGERTFLLSTHQTPTLSLLSWGEYWPVPLLQSPENQMSLKGNGRFLVALAATAQW